MMDRQQLLTSSGSTATGSNVTIDGGRYNFVYSCTSWNTGTLTLQFLGPDGATFINALPAVNVNGAQSVDVSQPTIAKIVVAGTLSANAFALLSRVVGPQ